MNELDKLLATSAMESFCSSVRNDDFIAAWKVLTESDDLCEDEVEVYDKLFLDKDADDNALILRWGPFEDCSAIDFFEVVTDQERADRRLVTEVMETVKQGIVRSAISGDLDLDFNCLDMADMFERGAADE